MHYHQHVHSRSISRNRTRYKDCPKAQGEHIRRSGLCARKSEVRTCTSEAHAHRQPRQLCANTKLSSPPLFWAWICSYFIFDYYISLTYLKMYFGLSWKTWKALFIELVSFFYRIYFLLLLEIWLSVENMFSTEPIVAFLDLCSCYIFWLHLWVNKNVDGCLK